jgi:5-carboxyvanillate decarboxylase
LKSYCAISGISWAPAVNFMQNALRPDRFMFAVDYPVENQPWTIKRAEEILISPADRKLFFQTNAERVFNPT